MQPSKKFIGCNVASVPNGEKYLDGFMKKDYLTFGMPLPPTPPANDVKVLCDEHMGHRIFSMLS
jgi:hypothetical protein